MLIKWAEEGGPAFTSQRPGGSRDPSSCRLREGRPTSLPGETSRVRMRYSATQPHKIFVSECSSEDAKQQTHSSGSLSL